MNIKFSLYNNIDHDHDHDIMNKQKYRSARCPVGPRYFGSLFFRPFFWFPHFLCPHPFFALKRTHLVCMRTEGWIKCYCIINVSIYFLQRKKSSGKRKKLKLLKWKK